MFPCSSIRFNSKSACDSLTNAKLSLVSFQNKCLEFTFHRRWQCFFRINTDRSVQQLQVWTFSMFPYCHTESVELFLVKVSNLKKNLNMYNVQSFFGFLLSHLFDKFKGEMHLITATTKCSYEELNRKQNSETRSMYTFYSVIKLISNYLNSISSPSITERKKLLQPDYKYSGCVKEFIYLLL